MSRETNRRSQKVRIVNQRQPNTIESVVGLLNNAFEQHRRNTFRRDMLCFLLGVMACLLIWMSLQNINKPSNLAEQPVLQRLDIPPVRPVATQPRKGKPERKNKEHADRVQADWQ